MDGIEGYREATAGEHQMVEDGGEHQLANHRVVPA
jgi:hypothetical protein